MHWLIQNKFDHDPKVRDLMYNLERMGVPYTRASVIPFSNDGITFETSDDVIKAEANGEDGSTVANIAAQQFVTSIDELKYKRIFTYGSYTMANISAAHFTPGAFVSPDISMLALTEHYGTEMLNHDMITGKVKDLNPDMDMFFIRPVEDTKSIVGAEYTKEYFTEWKQRIIDAQNEHPNTYATVTPDTLICIAPCKSIDAEFRCFVVNGKVATSSQYKMRRLPHFTPHVDEYIIDYVNALVKTWQPDKAFVLDVALTNGVLKIIEANCTNSSGLYEIDLQKWIMAVDEL